MNSSPLEPEECQKGPLFPGEGGLKCSGDLQHGSTASVPVVWVQAGSMDIAERSVGCSVAHEMSVHNSCVPWGTLFQ